MIECQGESGQLQTKVHVREKFPETWLWTNIISG